MIIDDMIVFYHVQNKRSFALSALTFLLIMEEIHANRNSSLYHPEITPKEANEKSCARYKIYVENEREKVYTYLGLTKEKEIYRQIKKEW